MLNLLQLDLTIQPIDFKQLADKEIGIVLIYNPRFGVFTFFLTFHARVYVAKCKNGKVIGNVIN